MIIESTLKDVENGMGKAFENWAIKSGYNVTDKTMFRCTKIEVSKEVDDYFWKYYRDQAKENKPSLSDEDIESSIAMMMLFNGAKRNDNLPKWTVDVQNEFAFEKGDD